MPDYSHRNHTSTLELISKAEENHKWLDQNYRQLTQRYNKRWVAVLDKNVIDHDRDSRNLAVRLRKNLEERYSEASIGYVAEKPIDMVLNYRS